MELLNGNIKQIEAFFSLAKLGDKRPGMWEALVGWGERNNVSFPHFFGRWGGGSVCFDGLCWS